MIKNSHIVALNLALVLYFLVPPVPTLAQTAQGKKLQAKSSKDDSTAETVLAGAERRNFAISLLTSLADEARSYHDEALRPYVLARVADALWDADSQTARVLFRRSWEAAEKGDEQGLSFKTQEGVPPRAAAMVDALRRSSGRDLRLDVLNFAARRDPLLGEEFLNKLKDTNRAEADSRKNPDSQTVSDSWSVPEAVSKRFHLARKLLDDGEIERALEFAAPVLDQVNVNSIGFLSALREKRPETADQRYALLLAKAEFHPASDANTASGLSSYVFTPGLYVTFKPDGGARWSQPDQAGSRLNPPNLPPALRNRFFQVAGNILLRPLPPPGQDFSSSGRIGKYRVIKRLLPFFDQSAADTASALRSQLTALADEVGTQAVGNDNPLLTQGVQTEETIDDALDALEKMQKQLDHAKTTQERDLIYQDAAAALVNQSDVRAQDLADKIDDPNRRAQVRRFVDFELVRLALRKKEAAEAVRLAKAGQLTHMQRVWAYTQAAQLLMKSEGLRAIYLLAEARDEARRIQADDADRARAFIAVANQFAIADPVRVWEIMAEAVKAANSAEKFTGENVQIRSAIVSKSGVKISSVGGNDFGISGVLRSLAKDDLYRSVDLARNFKRDAPRATAILAIASAVLAK